MPRNATPDKCKKPNSMYTLFDSIILLIWIQCVCCIGLGAEECWMLVFEAGAAVRIFLILGMRWKRVPFIIHVSYHNFRYTRFHYKQPASRVEAQREKEQMRRAWYTWIIYLCKCDDDDAYIPNEASGDGSRHRRTNERDSLYIFSCVCKYIIIIIGLYSMARLQHPDRFTHTLCVCCGLASGICTLL